MKRLERKKLLLELYFKRYDTLILDRAQVSKLLNKSMSTLDKWKEKGLGPQWSKDPRSKNGAVSYALDHVIDYIISQETYITV